MSVVRDIASELAGWLDERLVQGVYASVSVPVEKERARLRRTGRPFYDPVLGVQPDRSEVDRTARLVVRQSVFQATALGSFAGLGGAASVPPEVAATLVAIVRLAQRLGVVYGFDPESDRGRMAMWQALSAGLDVELPSSGPLGMRMSDLPRVLAPQVPDQASVAIGALGDVESATKALQIDLYGYKMRIDGVDITPLNASKAEEAQLKKLQTAAIAELEKALP